MERRAFLRALGAAAPLAWCAGCGIGPIVEPPALSARLPEGVTQSDDEVVVALDRVVALARPGSALPVPAVRLLVTRPGPDDYRALDAVCPHSGALITGVEDGALVCRAHRSAFDLTGALLRGPAERGLRVLPAVRDPAANVLRIRLG